MCEVWFVGFFLGGGANPRLAFPPSPLPLVRSRLPPVHFPPPMPFPLVLPPSLRSRPLKSSYVVWGSAVSSPAGLGWSSSRNRSWCISALKYDIWWQEF